MKTEKEKMIAGEMYDPLDAQLVDDRTRTWLLLKELNETREDDTEKRSRVLLELLPSHNKTLNRVMQHNFEFRKYKEDYRQQIINVWEQSVRATHDFLRPEDFAEIKALVATIDFDALNVYCQMNNEGVAGFVGLADRKIEMLFLHPDYFGQGLGKRLLMFAVNQLGADKVDVNEQNAQAAAFYKKHGFEVVERSDKDDQGRTYPLLRMKMRTRLGI